jgi:hypothetical protein
VPGAGTGTSSRAYVFTDNDLPAGKYAYRLKQIDRDGSFRYYGEAEVEIADMPLIALGTNYPNPFNPSTTIRYALRSQSRVRVAVYDALGRLVVELLNAEQAAGWNGVAWNAAVASGLYFFRIEAVSVNDQHERFTAVKKMILLN